MFISNKLSKQSISIQENIPSIGSGINAILCNWEMEVEYTHFKVTLHLIFTF